MEVKLPNLGDGIDSASVLSIAVSVGDTIEEDQMILELETDKAVAPINTTDAGVVEEILINVGDTVRMGTPVLRLKGGAAPAKSEAPQESAAPAPAAAPVAAPQAAAPQVQQSGSAQYTAFTNANPVTSPSIKRFAARFGLDLGRIQGTGNGGRITDEDVKNFISYLQATAFQAQPQAGGAAPEAAKPQLQTHDIDFSKFGPVDIQPASSLRKKIAVNLRDTWNNAPHVTQFDEADITDLMALRKKYKAKYEKKDASLTLTTLMIKALIPALKEFPQFNASFDEAKGEVIYKNYFHMGVAVDTESGLIVPVIRDVDKKSILDISLELNEVAEKARQRKVGMDDLQGSSFTLSNLGGLGVGHFTPLVNTPDVAIMGIAKGNFKPILNKKKEFEPRLMMPVCLSYDHRIIDGADGARFTRRVIEALENFDEKELKL
jgi:pyruvate dehydrogenase E2 component (dihydrolipoamide acetyltransferase)